MPERDSHGRLLPGHSVRRKTTNDERQAYIDALKIAMPPDRMLAILDTALELCAKHDSIRGYLAILRFVAEYQLGKPKQYVSVQSVSTTLQEWRQLLADREDDGAPGLLVDGDAYDRGD